MEMWASHLKEVFNWFDEKVSRLGWLMVEPDNEMSNR
jgi:hypothetical protein